MAELTNTGKKILGAGCGLITLILLITAIVVILGLFSLAKWFLTN